MAVPTSADGFWSKQRRARAARIVGNIDESMWSLDLVSISRGEWISCRVCPDFAPTLGPFHVGKGCAIKGC